MGRVTPKAMAPIKTHTLCQIVLLRQLTTMTESLEYFNWSHFLKKNNPIS